MFNLLFTSVGRRVELLRAFGRAYEQLGITGRIIATDISPLAPAFKLADRRYIVPRVDAPDYGDCIAEICSRERVSAVFPLIDPDIRALAKYRNVIEDTGARVVVVGRKAVEITADKWLTRQFFCQLGLPTPQSWLPATCDLKSLPLPLFVKPRQGSASKHAFAAKSTDELRFFSQYVPDAIIQEYLPGPEITMDVVTAISGRLMAVVARQRLEVRGGEVAKGVTIYDERLVDACCDIAAALPAVGPITVQCIMRGEEPCFTEINARFGGGIPLAMAAGVDVARMILADVAGITIDAPAIGDYGTGVYCTRFDDSWFCNQGDLEDLPTGFFERAGARHEPVYSAESMGQRARRATDE